MRANEWRQLDPVARRFLLVIELLTAALCLAAMIPASVDRTTLVRLGLLMVVSVGYAEAVDRSERLWVWLHSGRGAWAGQSSMLLFAGVLVLPRWAALVQCALVYLHIGLRNRRHATQPAHRWVWTATTVLLATLAASTAFSALGGGLERVTPTDLLAIAVALVVYSGVNLAVLLVGIRVAARPARWRSILPPRSEFAYEANKLVLGLLAAVLVVQTPLLTPVVLLLAAVLQRSSLVGELSNAASIDDKTGLLTWRAWRERALRQLQHAGGAPVALLLIDLDHFKVLNDVRGHLAGDEALAAVGRAIADELRGDDTVGRYGGEEFVVLLSGVTAQVAVDIGERLRARIARLELATGVTLTASIGVAACADRERRLDSLLDDADAAMYRAKHLGRNCVHLAG